MSFPLRLWPEAASAHARSIDLLIGSFGVLVWALSIPVFVLMFVYAVRYRRGRPADRDHVVSSNFWLEVSWSLIPFALVLVFYVWSVVLFMRIHSPPADAFTINVVGKQWMWKFEHPGGAREINELHVPVDTDVKLVMTSQDVIHDLYLPELRIKQDVLPGRYTTLWFHADRPGTYALRCAEFCGMDHSIMGGRFVVLPPGGYPKWLRTADNDGTLVAQGERLFVSKGCSGCHAAGSSVRAPSLAGIAGGPVPLADGRVVVADDQYLHDSILQPNRDVAAGYAPIMPTFANVLDEGEVMTLVAYIKSLPRRGPEGAR